MARTPGLLAVSHVHMRNLHLTPETLLGAVTDFHVYMGNCGLGQLVEQAFEGTGRGPRSQLARPAGQWVLGHPMPPT
jgi:hypothetical protein